MDSGRISGTGFSPEKTADGGVAKCQLFSQATVPQDEIISLLELLK